MSNPETTRPGPRERLLSAADELFYEQGITTIGLTPLLDRSGAARASLYSSFGSKDGLIREYLRRRSEAWQATVADALPARFHTPREQLLGIYAMLGEWFATPGYRGCPFINASAEAEPSDVVAEVRESHRAWVRELFTGLAAEAGAQDPCALSEQLVLLYDGSMVGAQLDESAAPALAASNAAAALLDNAIAAASHQRHSK